MLLLLQGRPRLGLHRNTPASRSAAAQHAPDRGQHRHQPRAAEAVRGALAVVQQARVEAQAGVDQEHALVDETHVHRPHVAGFQGREHVLHRLLRLQRQRLVAREIVEGPHGQHAHGHALRPGRGGHGIDGAVAARRHHQPAVGLGGTRGLAGQLHDVGPRARHMPAHRALLQMRHGLELGAQLVQVGARAQRHHDVHGSVGRGPGRQIGRG